MYQLLLTRKYLTSKIMPLLASASLMLCTALVLVVWSVMGGFLRTLLDNGRTFAGDVSITWPSGIPLYDDLLDRLRKDPMVAAATPVIETFGVVKLPDDRIEGVQIKGIDGPSYSAVVDFDKSLWWRPLSEPLPRDRKRTDPRLEPLLQNWEQIYQDGLHLTKKDAKTGRPVAAVVLGIDMSSFNKRNDAGVYIPQGLVRPKSDGSIVELPPFLHQQYVTLNMFPQDANGRLPAPVTKSLPVANEFRTGVYEMDRRTVFVQFEELQRQMKMDGAPAIKTDGTPYNPYAGLDSNTGSPAPIVTDGLAPARTSSVIVRAAPGITPDALRKRCQEIYAAFADAHPGVAPAARKVNDTFVRTWAMSMAHLVNAVEKETALVLFLFWFITGVCSVLILAIFWAMISEKTKDIGILRAVGASRRGIASMWIFYGTSIGIVGSLLGFGLGWLIVSNINEIHEWLGQTFNLFIWDPKTYLFSRIPDRINPRHALIVFSAGILFAILGSIIPALRAALLKPVKALRFE